MINNGTENFDFTTQNIEELWNKANNNELNVAISGTIISLVTPTESPTSSENMSKTEDVIVKDNPVVNSAKQDIFIEKMMDKEETVIPQQDKKVGIFESAEKNKVEDTRFKEKAEYDK